MVGETACLDGFGREPVSLVPFSTAVETGFLCVSLIQYTSTYIHYNDKLYMHTLILYHPVMYMYLFITGLTFFLLY